MALIRSDLDTLAEYIPGRAAPGATKLVSNEVALPPPAAVLAAIVTAAMGTNRYPDQAATELAARISRYLGVDAARIATGCGSVSICQQLVQITCLEPADEVLFAWRSFEAYPLVTQVAGATARTVPLTADFRHDLDAMAAAVGPRTRLVQLCSPNNPTGTALTRAQVERFLAAVGPNVVVALDEAYHEFQTDPDAVNGMDLLDDHPNLVVLRTFSKAWRLASLRVGYAVASVVVAEALRKVRTPFSVSAVAQAAAIAALDSADEVLETCAEVATERVRVRDALLAAGYDVPPTQANFVWLPLGERAQAFTEYCQSCNLVVRPFPPEGVRVTVSTPAENDAFLAAARTFTGRARTAVI
jgi:histidinol-phosphate aminotransferase